MTEPHKPVELIAKSPMPIINMCVFNDRLFVATTDGVFERLADGSFHEIRLIKAGEAS